jgi:hypothetical protein
MSRAGAKMSRSAEYCCDFGRLRTGGNTYFTSLAAP